MPKTIYYWKKRNCTFCNSEFQPTHSKQKYCTITCVRYDEAIKKHGSVYFKIKYCLQCNDYFMPTFRERKFCSTACSNKYRNDNKKPKIIKCENCGNEFKSLVRPSYCPKCSDLYKCQKRLYEFNFNPYKHPDLFDLKELKERGVYYHNGHKNPNPDGLVRDHRVSVKESVDNNPVNCEYMPFIDNHIKKDKSSITYEQLIKEVDLYDKKLLINQ